jgi:mRNA interferase RelE/StbE
MAFFQIKYKSSVEKEIRRIPEDALETIVMQIDSLSNNPFPVGYKKLFGEELYRVRVGDYRIIYSIDSKNQIITIERIGHRKDIYRKN